MGGMTHLELEEALLDGLLEPTISNYAAYCALDELLGPLRQLYNVFHDNPAYGFGKLFAVLPGLIVRIETERERRLEEWNAVEDEE